MWAETKPETVNHLQEDESTLKAKVSTIAANCVGNKGNLQQQRM